MNVLVVNCGSSSIKYQVFDTVAARMLKVGTMSGLSGPEGVEGALRQVFQEVSAWKIDAVGHRVVHGGETLTASCILDEKAIATVKSCIPLAPLHNPANLAGVQTAKVLYPDVPHVAVFDTAFHSRLPRRAKSYAIPPELAEKHGIRRFGFHGISHAFVSREAARHLGRPLNELRLISCHLGNGASVCAVEYGRSVETSMGMSPLEGLVMGTRCGDLDPAVVLELIRQGHRAEEVDHLLNRESGLKGLSGVSNDLREVQTAAADGNEQARLAIGVFAHRVRKYIGAYAAVMGGVDAIVLTGGIGENSASMRRRILQRLEFLGVVLGEDRNASAKVDDVEQVVVDISAYHSRSKVLVVATNEERMIAEETAKIVEGATTVQHPGPIPIAVSARHVHLSKETFQKLFGEDATLTKRRDLRQPGQFAAEEQVTLIGPRDSIERVRILGPLRSKDQVEIARTDEFRLGVDAPIRDSGKLDGSAPILLEGPQGRVSLAQGLICAKRHIHMTPEDAERYGVQDGDEVEVAISGGLRDLIFGDVTIRVSPKYMLEMHIDTDEANAAELVPKQAGELVYVLLSSSVQADIRQKRLR